MLKIFFSVFYTKKDLQHNEKIIVLKVSLDKISHDKARHKGQYVDFITHIYKYEQLLPFNGFYE